MGGDGGEVLGYDLGEGVEGGPGGCQLFICSIMLSIERGKRECRACRLALTRVVEVLWCGSVVAE